MPADTDWNLFTTLTPAFGEGYGSPDAVAGGVAILVPDGGTHQ